MKKTASKGAERRKFSRFKYFDIIRLSSESGAFLGGSPTLVNVSLGGLCFYCNDRLKLNDRISVSIHISRFHCVVKSYARVAWTQASTEHAGVFFTGVEFVGLDETDRDVIRRLEKARRGKR